MVDIQALINTGTLVMRPAQSPQSTVIVLGAARGGTSMAAGALSHLGVFMGDKLSVVFEDAALSAAVEKSDDAALSRLIDLRNAAFPIWGWKRPAAIRYLPGIEAYFRNPCYVVVFRDVFAIANRNRISMLSDVMSNMRTTLAHYVRILDFIESRTAPCMLVSYEKAMLDRAAFVDALSAFVGIGTAQTRQLAVDSIQASPEDYLKGSRITDSNGAVNRVEARHVAGWAMYKRVLRPAQVTLMVNGQEVAQAIANRMRPDVHRRNIHPTGKCGFVFEIPADRALRAGDEIRVRAVGDIKDLRGSPTRFTPGAG
jgi:hypothetical protein